MTLGVDDELLVRNGYARVYQDVRGIHRSEGDYVMTLPPRGPLNSGKVDHTTDTWDTIDWLVEERSGQQRQGRDHRRFLRRLPHPRGAASILIRRSPPRCR